MIGWFLGINLVQAPRQFELNSVALRVGEFTSFTNKDYLT